MSLDKILEINQSLINATAQLCARTTLVLTGNTSLTSQLPTLQPPSLKSISNQALHHSTISTATGQSVSGTRAISISAAEDISSHTQSSSSLAQEVKSMAAAKPICTTSQMCQSVSVAQTATSVQGTCSSTVTSCAVQTKGMVSSIPVLSASSTAVVQARAGQTGSISTATGVLAQGGSVSMPQSLPPPTTSTTTAATNSSVIKSSSSSHALPGPNDLQTASLTNPMVQVPGTLRSTVSAANLTQSNNSVALSNVSAQSSGVIVTSSTSKQSKAVSTAPPATQTTVSATPTHTFRDPVSVASSSGQPYIPSSNFPYSFGAPVIISQSGQRGVVPLAQPTTPHGVQPAIMQARVHVGQSAPPPMGPGMPTGRAVFGQVISTVPGQIMSTGAGGGGWRVPTGVGRAVPSVLAQVVQPGFGGRAVGQMIPPGAAPQLIPRVIQGTAPQAPLSLPPPPPPGARILPGFPPGSAKQSMPPPLQPRVTAPGILPPRVPQLVTQGVQVGAAQMVLQGIQIGVPRVVSQNVSAVTANNPMRIDSSESVMTNQGGGQGSLPTSLEASGQRTSVTAPQEMQKKTAATGEEKAKEPEVRKRGRPRKVNQQEEEEKDGKRVATVIKRGRGRPRKQSHDVIYEECAPSNQGGDGKDGETRRSSRKRKLKSPDGATLAATASTNEVIGSDVGVAQGRQMMDDIATQSVRLSSKKAATEVCASNPPSLSSANSVPTKTTSVIVSSNKASDTSLHSVTASSACGTISQTSNDKGEKLIAEDSTSTENVVEPDNTENEEEIEQNVPPKNDNIDTQAEREASSNDDLCVPEDPLYGLKTKRRREEEEEDGEEREEGGGMEKRSRMEEPEEDEGNGPPASPELITSETEVDSGDPGEMMGPETRDSSDTTDKGESKKDGSNSDSTGTKLLESEPAQISDSKPTAMSDSTTKSNDKTASSTHESNGGRKCLGLRRHSTGPSTASSGDGVSGEGGERGEVEGGGGGEREETAVGESRKPSLVDTPTNGKGGILKHTSQFDTPSTAKVSVVD